MENEMPENGTEKIPPIIHYCWFGGNPLPDMARKCIASWRKYCPGYQIIEWNETNFDINYNDYMREAYEAKKWAFVSDVARLYALSAMGGIYMDTDVELLKPLDSLRQYEAVSGFECQTRISTGLMACREGQEMFLEFLSAYNDIHFRLKDGSFDLTPNVTRITDACLKYGLSLDNKKQTVRGFTLLPSEYLCPKNFETLETKITEHTLCIHHFDGSWLSDEDKYRIALKEKMHRFFSAPLSGHIARFISIAKYESLTEAMVQSGKWLRQKKKDRKKYDI